MLFIGAASGGAKREKKMATHVLWDTMGNILAVCDDEDEALEVMEDCGYAELYRTNGRNGEVNIAVLDV